MYLIHIISTGLRRLYLG